MTKILLVAIDAGFDFRLKGKAWNSGLSYDEESRCFKMPGNVIFSDELVKELSFSGSTCVITLG